MNILITGGAGYIGSIVVEVLLEQDHTVIVIDNLQEGHREAILPEAIFYEGDIGNRELLNEVFGNHEIEAIFHFAAETTTEFSMADPRRYFYNNFVKSFTLLDAMLEHSCDRFIFSSTAAVFGEAQYVPIDERHPLAPINAYGESKLMFERLLDWYHSSYGLRYNVFRYFNAAGASERLGEAHKNESHLIPVIINSILRQNRPVRIFGKDYSTKDGTCIRDYIHVLDLAQAHVLGVNNLEKYPNRKYNLGNEKGFSNLEVVGMIEKISGQKVNYSFAPRRVGDPAILVASSKLAQKELGWNPKYNTLDRIVESAWIWHSNHPYGYRSL